MSRARSRVARVAIVAALIALSAGLGCNEPERPRDVLLITVDTLRPDFLHVYGFPHETSPNIDALAGRGVLFENALAAASLTAPAHASIMTSRFVREHSIGPLNGETRLTGVETLAERFKAAGYETAAFVSNVVLRRRSGLDRGFDVYDDELPSGELNRRAYYERTAEATAARALDWLSQEHTTPVFVWLHIQDPHGPYTPPAPFLGQIEDVSVRVQGPLDVLQKNSGRAGIPAYQALPGVDRPAEYAARYAEEILFADHWIGAVIDAMRDRVQTLEPIILLTADHGESMGEQGWFFQHGQSATPDLARVPFVVSAPGIEQGRSDQWVSHVDIAPTLLELAGAGGLVESSGISLVSILRDGEKSAPRVLFVDTEGEAAAYASGNILRARGGDTIGRPGQSGGEPQFETMREKELGVWRPGTPDAKLRTSLVEYIDGAVPLEPAREMAPEHVEQLRALGYLDPLPKDEVEEAEE